MHAAYGAWWQGGASSGDRRCYHCGEPGHFANNCPLLGGPGGYRARPQSYDSYGGITSGRDNGAPSPYPLLHDIDPSDYGWRYQGCNVGAKVEFWVSDSGVRLDLYPTTGTVKTVMDHPTQGRTQMFRRGLSAAGFLQVLQNPRQHTGRGYQRRGTAGYHRGFEPY